MTIAGLIAGLEHRGILLSLAEGGIRYRSAKGDAELGGSDSGADLDWSGVMTRVGLIYFLK